MKLITEPSVAIHSFIFLSCIIRQFLFVIVQPLIITVQENETVLDDTPDKFSIEAVCNIS